MAAAPSRRCGCPGSRSRCGRPKTTPAWPGCARDGIPIAAGENAAGVQTSATLRAGAIDICQPSVIKFGGVEAVAQAAALAREHGVRYVPHCFYFGPGYLASLHLAAALAPETPFELFFGDLQASPYHDWVRAPRCAPGRPVRPRPGRRSGPERAGPLPARPGPRNRRVSGRRTTAPPRIVGPPQQEMHMPCALALLLAVLLALTAAPSFAAPPAPIDVSRVEIAGIERLPGRPYMRYRPSPDGRQAAFSKSYRLQLLHRDQIRSTSLAMVWDIWLLDPATGLEEKLVDVAADYAWSPDGLAIAYIAPITDEGTAATLYRLDVGGGAARKLAEAEIVGWGWPLVSWLPTDEIAYVDHGYPWIVPAGGRRGAPARLSAPVPHRSTTPRIGGVRRRRPPLLVLSERSQRRLHARDPRTNGPLQLPQPKDRCLGVGRGRPEPDPHRRAFDPSLEPLVSRQPAPGLDPGFAPSPAVKKRSTWFCMTSPQAFRTRFTKRRKSSRGPIRSAGRRTGATSHSSKDGPGRRSCGSRARTAAGAVSLTTWS